MAEEPDYVRSLTKDFENFMQKVMTPVRFLIILAVFSFIIVYNIDSQPLNGRYPPGSIVHNKVCGEGVVLRTQGKYIYVRDTSGEEKVWYEQEIKQENKTISINLDLKDLK